MSKASGYKAWLCASGGGQNDRNPHKVLKCAFWSYVQNLHTRHEFGLSTFFKCTQALYPEAFDTSPFPKCCAFQKVLIVWCFDPFWGLQQHFKKRVENPLLQAILSRYAEKVLFWTIFRDFPSSVQICHQMQWPNPFGRVLGLFKASPVCKGKVLGCTWRKLRDPIYAPYGGFQNMCSWGTPQLHWSISSAPLEYDFYFFWKPTYSASFHVFGSWWLHPHFLS